jgi:tRNA (cmo5U34)-methyltransferase
VSEKDRIYATGLSGQGAFCFDQNVVRVFPDMINRSVPSYAQALQIIGLSAARYVQPDSRVYDLGCSLGAATLAMRRAVKVSGVRFIAVDNSPDMIAQCEKNMAAEGALPPVELVLADVLEAALEDASMTVLNFTLQFIEPEQRLALLQRIHAATRPGGVLVLSEKICFADPLEQELQSALHVDYKRAQGYSDLEIAAKRNALERVLRPDTEAQHLARLRAAGWRSTLRCCQALNFATYLALR